MTDRAARPLDGLTVLELGTMYAAPTVGRMLRDFGAEVIKVEDPVTGDYARHWSPQKDGLAMGFARLNAGKRSIALDLRLPHCRDVVRRLAATVDVVVESFRPGRLEAWDLGYDTLSADNPGLVLTRVSGFGQTGPYRRRPGFGTVAETASGFAHINRWPEAPPQSPPFGFADSITGISAAMGTMIALYRRSTSGRGDVVDAALYEPMMFLVGDTVLFYEATGEVIQPAGRAPSGGSPRGIFQCSDGRWLSISASNQSIAERLFVAMDRAELLEDPRFATNADRLANDAEIRGVVEAWVAARPRGEALAVLEEHEVVCAPVNDAADIAADPHFSERTLVPITGHGVVEGARMPGPVVHLGSYEGPTYDGVPALGEHTTEVLSGRLSLDQQEISQLRTPLADPHQP